MVKIFDKKQGGVNLSKYTKPLSFTGCSFRKKSKTYLFCLFLLILFTIKLSSFVFARGIARRAATTSSKRAASSSASARRAASSSKARAVSGSTSTNNSSSNNNVATTTTNAGSVDDISRFSKLLDNLIINDVRIINELNDVNNKLKEVLSSIKVMSERITVLEKKINSSNTSSSSAIKYPVPVRTVQYGGCAYSSTVYGGCSK